MKKKITNSKTQLPSKYIGKHDFGSVTRRMDGNFMYDKFNFSNRLCMTLNIRSDV